jgi:hypothetical protein
MAATSIVLSELKGMVNEKERASGYTSPLRLLDEGIGDAVVWKVDKGWSSVPKSNLRS